MPVSTPLEIAALVRETRYRLGLTQLQFAQKLGVWFQSVNRWENGRTQPLPIVLKQIEAQLRRWASAVLICWVSISQSNCLLSKELR
ncbi:helix-turn-helix transcriptional regulator [Trichocoleus sp. DQ-U1]|uniref:helix-turn-helix domain-containing protein n=1 Tax=Trichocoleus sp. DQ-U1 TaxID=2933926 RepID=UPI0032993573